jgi:hypothetical protein
VLAAAEAKSLVEARRVLGLGIGDLIELTEGSPERTSAIDAALRDAGIMTLSEVRAKFGRAIRAIMKRGALRNEAEYYSLRNAVEAMPEPDQIEAWRLLGEFETRAG